MCVCVCARAIKDGHHSELRCTLDAVYFVFRVVRDIPPPDPSTRVQNSRGPPICAQASVTPSMLERYAKRRLALRTKGHVRARVSASLLPRTRLDQDLHSLIRADPFVEHDFVPWCQGTGAGGFSQRTLGRLVLRAKVCRKHNILSIRAREDWHLVPFACLSCPSTLSRSLANA